MLRTGPGQCPFRGHRPRCPHRARAVGAGPGDHAARGHRTRRDRRNQPRSRRRRNLRLPASAGPDLARIVVPADHKQAGGPGMRTTPASGTPAPGQALQAEPGGHSRDRRGSPIPTVGMIATRVMELRKRRGLMIALIVATIGFPALFLLIRLLLHAFVPRTRPPAGGYDIFTVLVAGFLPTFGFIGAATVGCTAGSRDLTEGMFRHLVVTGRSRLALYLARIPAGLAIVVPLVAIGYTIVCAVSVFAAPAFIDDSNVNIPPACHSPASRTGPGTTPRRSSAISTTGTFRGMSRAPRPASLVEVSSHPRPARARQAGSSGHQDRQARLLWPKRLHRDFPLPVDLPHDQGRAVARA